MYSLNLELLIQQNYFLNYKNKIKIHKIYKSYYHKKTVKHKNNKKMLKKLINYKTRNKKIIFFLLF
jgi:hypothetical protein